MPQTARAPGGTARFGVFEVDLRAGELRKGGSRVRLQEQPFQVLVALIERPGEVVTRDELRERLWPSGVVVDFDHSLNKAVNKVREALGDAAENPRFIETLPKRGYRFIAPVQLPPTAGARPETPVAAQPAPVALEEHLENPPTAGPVLPDPGALPAGPKIVPDIVMAESDSASARARLVIVGLGVVLVVLVLGSVWRMTRGDRSRASALSGRVMLAVLPFRNLAGSGDEDYFSDGLTEEMIAQLGRLQPQRLGVIARTSSMHYKNTEKLVAQIADELAVDYLLEGSVRRAGGRVRITAQLVRTDDQTPLWSETYDRDLRDVFAIQSEVTRRIVSSLALELLPRQTQAISEPPTTNMAAHEEYLRGRFQWSKRTEESLQRSLEHFERAVAADKAYALGYVGTADSYNLLADYGALSPADALPRARSAALEALRLAPDLAEAHASLAWTTLVYDRDVAAAQAGFERAIALNPAYASAHQWYAFALKAAGRHDEALRAVRRAQELDPLSLIINAVVAWHHYYARQYDEAIAQCTRVIAMDPTFSRVHSYLGWSLVQKGQFEEGLQALRKASDLFGTSPARELEWAYALAAAGRAGEARAVVDTVLKQARGRYIESDLVARVHVALGDRDRAFEWFDRALEEHAPKLVLLKVDPRLDPIRADPRFAELLRRAGLGVAGT
jgi:TolB-like protein/DNA-binding winged helix-turn-helix (wHTH) protein/Flp pilus assembly protein TadD